MLRDKTDGRNAASSDLFPHSSFVVRMSSNEKPRETTLLVW